MSDISDRKLLELRLHVLTGAVLSNSRGYSTKETEKEYAKAEMLARTVDDPKETMPVFWGAWLVRHLRGEADICLQVAEDMMTAAPIDDPEGDRVRS